MSNDNSNVGASDDECPIYFGTPTIKEVKEYLRRLQKMPLNPQEIDPETSEESSFEFDDSFQTMIERKRKQMIESRLKELEDVAESPPPRLSAAKEDAAAAAASNSLKFRGNDSTFIEQDSMRKTITDESFEEMERLCSMNVSKLGVSKPLIDEEEEVIRRILESSSKSKAEGVVGSTEVAKASNITMGLSDVTQLDDVEEPSCLWENTIAQGASGKEALSPVKRMHMLRPSTIIEEATINETTSAGVSSKNTSHDSYITAKQNLNGSGDCSTVAGSDVYRTADDESCEHSKASNSNAGDSAAGLEATTLEKISIETKEDESVNGENRTAEEDDDVIVLSSSDSEAEDEPNDGGFLPVDCAKMDTGSMFNNSDSLQEDPLCLEDSVDREVSGSPVLDAIPDHFNDTMEEMEFMMRQGMKILQQQKAQQQSASEQPAKQTTTGSIKKPFVASHTTPVTPIDSNRYLKPTHHTSNAKQNLFSSSASKSNSAQKPSSAPPTGANSCGTFKKPVNRFPLPKSAKKFDHIVSPIGEYIKNTPKTPLQARIFCANHNLIDVLHNKNDNRDSAMSSKENLAAQQQDVDAATYSSSLPRKGVVSSRGAHVLDERNPVRIPGGEKVHKLLNNSPTMVVRHEGRLRYQRETQLTEDSVVDDSLADLSLASGDISVRVLKDVRRF